MKIFRSNEIDGITRTSRLVSLSSVGTIGTAISVIGMLSSLQDLTTLDSSGSLRLLTTVGPGKFNSAAMEVWVVDGFEKYQSWMDARKLRKRVTKFTAVQHETLSEENVLLFVYYLRAREYGYRLQNLFRSVWHSIS